MNGTWKNKTAWINLLVQFAIDAVGLSVTYNLAGIYGLIGFLAFALAAHNVHLGNHPHSHHHWHELGYNASYKTLEDIEYPQ